MRERIQARLLGSVTLALLYLITVGVTGARARTIPFRQSVDDGVRVISCDSPSFLDDSAIGHWQLITLNLESQGWNGNATLMLSRTEAGEWTAPVVLSAGRVTAAEIGIPCRIDYSSISFALNDGKHTLAAGLLDLTPPAMAKGYGGYGGYPGEGSGYPGPPSTPIPARYQFAASSYLEIAGPKPILPGTIPSKEMECLGARVGFLDNVHLIIVPFNSSADRWRQLPGIDFWLRTGGILVQTHRPDARLSKQGEKWTRVGAGGIVDYPGVPDLNYLQRITAAAQTVADGTYQISMTPDLFPESDVPLAALAAILAAYFILALPINYLTLRKLRRRELSWITIPALSVIFAWLVIGACYAAKRDSTIVARVSVVQEWAPGAYTARGYDAIFAPKAARYDAVFPPESLPEGPTAQESEKFWPSTWDAPPPIHLRVNEGAPTAAQDIEVPQWCSRLLTYSFMPPVTGAITGTVSYSPRRGWKVTAHNGSSLALEDCRAGMPDGGWIWIGALPPGGTVSASGPAAPLPDEPGNGAAFQSRLRYRTLSALQGSPLALVGWTTAPIQSTRIRGGAQYLDQTMVVAPLELAAGPDGLWGGPRMYLSVTSDPILCPLQTGRSGEKRYQMVGVVLPAAARSRPHAVLQLRISTSKPTTAMLWDPRRGTWRTIGRIGPHRALTTPIQNPAAMAIDLPGPQRDPVVYVRGAGSGGQQRELSVLGEIREPAAAGTAVRGSH